MSQSGSVVKVEHIKAISIIIKRWVNLFRSSFIGIFTGILPAAGGSISNILAYDQAKKASNNSSNFGKGEYDGVNCSRSCKQCHGWWCFDTDDGTRYSG